MGQDAFIFLKISLLGEGSMLSYKGSLNVTLTTLALCHLAALNAWNKVEESGKRSESFSKITQGPKEVFTGFFFLQRLTSAVKRILSDRSQTNII